MEKDSNKDFENNEQEAPKFIDSEDKKQLIGAVTELIKTTSLNDIAETIFDSQTRKKEIQLEIEEKKKELAIEFENKKIAFWKMRFFKESVIIILVLFAVSFLAYNKLIDQCTLGTLLGSIIGYTIGNFNLSKGK